MGECEWVSFRRVVAGSRLVVTTAAALLMFGVLPAGATPSTGHVRADQAVDIDCEPGPTEVEDIEFMAEQDGIPLDDAVARYGWQGCFGEVTSYLSEAYPDEYAGAAIVDGGLDAWIAFRGDVPAEAEELVGEIPVTVQLIGGKGFSEAELNQALEAAYADVYSHQDVVDASGSYDIETGVITIRAQPSATRSDADQRARLHETLRPDPPTNAAITIDVTIVDEPGGAGESSSNHGDGLQVSAIYAGLVAAGILAVGARLLMRHRRLR